MSLRSKSIALTLSAALCLPIFQIGTSWAIPEDEGRYSALSAETLALIDEVNSAEEGTFRDNSVIVTLDEEHDAESAERAVGSLDSDGAEVITETQSGEPILSVSLPEGMTVAEAIAEYSLDPDVKSVQPNYVYRLVDGDQEDASEAEGASSGYSPMAAAKYPVNDPYANVSTPSTTTPNEWYLDSVNAQQGWTDSRTNNAVTVAIVDTGINFNHVDLTDNIDRTYARSFSYNYDMTKILSEHYATSETDSRYGHGTHVAGIVSARANNGLEFAGTSYNATILPLKVFYEASGYALPVTDDLMVIAAYNYIFSLKDAGYDSLKVVNLSLGGEERDAAFESVVNKAKSQYGILTVCAAGNENTSTPTYPSDFPNVISVTSIDSSDRKSDFSNYGSAKDIAAPGTNIWSTYVPSSTDIGMASGTSQAAPMVSGAAALLWAKDPSLSPDRVQSILCSTATPLPNIPSYYYMGKGKLNIEAALASLQLSVGRISIKDFDYTGNAADTISAITVTSENGTKLTYGTDYSLAFKDSNGHSLSQTPVNAGLYSVTVSGNASNSGSEALSGTLRISRRDINDKGVTSAMQTTVTYTGYAQTPLPKLSFGSESLVPGVDYYFSFANNVNAGSAATVKCLGSGNFSGERTIKFTIAKSSTGRTFGSVRFENTTVSSLSQFSTIVTNASGTRLTEGKDYTVSYCNKDGIPSAKPTTAGVYSVYVNGMGSYSECTISSGVRITSERTVPAGTSSKISRITQGVDAADTAAAISESTFAASEYVIIAKYDTFEDAMSATGLAGILDAPILLTQGSSLSRSAATEIMRLNATKAYIIGGNLSIKPQVESDLGAAGILSVKRLSGQTAWDTSVVCARELTGLKQVAGDACSYAIISTPTTFEDALSISSFAYKYHVPIFLQQGGATAAQRRLSNEADALIGSNYSNATIYVPGGVLSVSNESIAKYPRTIRLTSGTNAYDTSNYIAQYMTQNNLLSSSCVSIACGAAAYKGSDALAGAALAGKNSGVMLLMNESGSGPSNNVVLSGFVAPNRSQINELFVLGGPIPMPNSAVAEISAVLR